MTAPSVEEAVGVLSLRNGGGGRRRREGEKKPIKGCL
jgi:hypothetical protein